MKTDQITAQHALVQAKTLDYSVVLKIAIKNLSGSVYLENFVAPRENSDDVPGGEGNVQEKSHPNNVILSNGEPLQMSSIKQV